MQENLQTSAANYAWVTALYLALTSISNTDLELCQKREAFKKKWLLILGLNAYVSVDSEGSACVSTDACDSVLGSIRGVLGGSVDGNREIDAGRLNISISTLIMVAYGAHRFPTLVSSHYLSTQRLCCRARATFVHNLEWRKS